MAVLYLQSNIVQQSLSQKATLLARWCGHITDGIWREEKLNAFIEIAPKVLGHIREGGMCWEFPLKVDKRGTTVQPERCTNMHYIELIYSETYVERPLLWETTCLEGPLVNPTFQCKWTSHQRPPVLRDHIFMASGVVFQNRFHCTADSYAGIIT